MRKSRYLLVHARANGGRAGPNFKGMFAVIDRDGE